MIRGRHRGLPVAIDRAIMLPSEFTQKADQELDHHHWANAHRARPDDHTQDNGTTTYSRRSGLGIVSEIDRTTPSKEGEKGGTSTESEPSTDGLSPHVDIGVNKDH